MRARFFALPLLTAALIILLVVAATGNARTQSQGTAQATVKAGLVTDIGGLNDRSFNHLANLGRLKAQKELKVSTRVIESKSGGDYIPNLTTLAHLNYKIIIGVGFLMADAIDTVAQKFPNLDFAIIDYCDKNSFSTCGGVLTHSPKNTDGLFFKSEQSGYLVGYLAGLMVKKQGGKQVVSAVGGQSLPSVNNWIAGYKAGAKKSNPKVTVLIDYSNQFPVSASPKCKSLAENQIARGSQVIFQVAGGCGLGALDAAKEHHKGKRPVWGIGVDADQAYLGAHILTSGVKRVDLATFDVIKAVKNGTFKGGRDLVFDLKNHGQDVGKISSKVPKAFITKMNAIKKLIISGKIKPPAKL
ncbi:MAG: BMP family ABC transporter substrate-binding protein [Gaiellaceae bacterium]